MIARSSEDVNVVADSDGNIPPTAPEWLDSSTLRNVIAEPLNSRVVLSCKASGWPQPSIRWTKDGIPVEEDKQDPFNNYRVGFKQLNYFVKKKLNDC